MGRFYGVTMKVPRVAARNATPFPDIAVNTGAPDANSNVAITWKTGLVLFCYAACIFTAVFYNGQVFKFSGDKISALVNYGIYACAASSMLLGIILLEFSAVAFSVSLYAFFTILVMIGAKLSPLGFQSFMLVQFIPILYTPLISFLFRRGVFREFYLVTAIVVALYCITYDYLSSTVHASSEMQLSGSGFIATSGGRDSRIGIEGVATLICLFLGLSGLKARSNTILSLIMIAASVAAFYFSLSRTIEINALIFSIVFLLFGTSKYLDRAMKALVVIATIAFILILLQGYNIYEQNTSWDVSVSSRAAELENARQWIMGHMITGVGFVSPLRLGDHVIYDPTKDVFWNDLGIYGVLYVGGFIGVAVYMTMNWMLVSSRAVFQSIGMPRHTRDGLAMAGICIAATSVSVPTAWGTGLVLCAIALAGYTCLPPARLRTAL
jgi:hypothetical protein